MTKSWPSQGDFSKTSEAQSASVEPDSSTEINIALLEGVRIWEASLEETIPFSTSTAGPGTLVSWFDSL